MSGASAPGREAAVARKSRGSLAAPLGNVVYRRIWSASLLSNFGSLIQGVGAAWEMTRLTASPAMVASVQTAIMLPLMLVALPAGAIADMFDRRKVALTGLGFACLSGIGLTACAFAGLVTPWLLLSFCFLVGVGGALYGPAWQSSVGEQVPAEQLPAAVALSSISYNIARSFGPAVGGAIVVAAGARAAFGTNAASYLPLMLALLLWRRDQVPARLPPERLDRAIISGARYVIHSPPIRVILLRTLLSGIAASSVSALTPLVARDLLHGTAGTYGLLLGAFGLGAVSGAMFIDTLRERLAAEAGVRLCAILLGAMVVVVGLSHDIVLSCLALAIAGAAWMLLTSTFNVGVQLSAPRWVTARALAWYSTAITGGLAFGAWIWGQVAASQGIGTAMIASGIAIAATASAGLVLSMPHVASAETEFGDREQEPEVRMAVTPRSGPIVIEIDYRVPEGEARSFYGAMQAVRGSRLRSGGFDWSLSRDIADPELWTERYQCPTWRDYLRQRNRATHSDQQALLAANGFHVGEPAGRVRRRLERPFGSVRWQAESPDPQGETVSVYPL